MRVAFFLGLFPAVSETFVLNQITGLIDLGHDVYIYAERAPEDGAPIHAAVASKAHHSAFSTDDRGCLHLVTLPA